jgi:hypothetical protein
MSTITWIADKVIDRRRKRTETHLRVHRAFLTILNGQLLAPPVEAYFLNVWNASPEQPVQITHVYVETPTGQLSVLTKALPVTVPALHEWETWLPVANVPQDVDVTQASRARLSNGTVVESVERHDVPSGGAVPNG